MHSLPLLSIILTAFVVSPAAASVCNAGIYGLLAPLAAVPEASTFCSQKFCTASNARRDVPYLTARGHGKSTSITTSCTTTTTTMVSSAQKTSSSASSTMKTTTKASTTVATTTGKAALLSQLSTLAYDVESTFCSCYFPSVTTSYAPCPSTCIQFQLATATASYFCAYGSNDYSQCPSNDACPGGEECVVTVFLNGEIDQTGCRSECAPVGSYPIIESTC